MDVVVGVDAGGSFTRALCVGLDGSVLGRASSGGGSPAHNADARANIRAAIIDSLEAAGSSVTDVVAIVAGIAGFDVPSDAEWAHEFIAVPGIGGVRIAVNDTEVAHAGAFGGGLGIMAIAGTGSMIFGVNEAGDKLRNDQYMHYAGAARHLSFDVIQHVLLDVDSDDSVMADAAFRHWNAKDLTGLRAAIVADIAGDHDEMKRHFGAFAPVITSLATRSPLASAAIARLAESTRVGIDLLAGRFQAPSVPVALEGGLACSQAFNGALMGALASGRSRCTIVQPQASPVEGAALLARRAVGGRASP